MLLSAIKALPAILAIVTAILGLIRSTRDRKAGADEIIIKGLEEARKKLDEMATIAASQASDDEIEDKLKNGTF